MRHGEAAHVGTVQVHLSWVVELKGGSCVAAIVVPLRVNKGLMQVARWKDKALARSHSELSLWSPLDVLLASVDLLVSKARGVEVMLDLRKGLNSPSLFPFELHGNCGLAVRICVCESPTSSHRKPELERFVGLHPIGYALLKEVRCPPVLLNLPFGFQRLFVFHVPNVWTCYFVLPSHVLRMASLWMNSAVPVRILQVDVVLPRGIFCSHVARRPALSKIFTFELANGVLVKSSCAVIHNERHTVSDELLKGLIV